MVSRKSKDPGGMELRILMIHHNYLPEYNGAALQAHRLSLALVQKGCQVRILAGASTKNLVGNNHVDGIPIYRVPRYGSGVWKLWFALAMIHYLLINARHFHVIHVHTFIVPVNFALFFTKTPGVQKITRLGYDDIDSLCSGRKGWIYKLLLKSVKKVINPIEGYKIEKTRGIHFANISNGVDTKLFNRVDEMKKQTLRKQLELPLNRTILLYMGSFIARKRVDRIIKVMSWLKENYFEMPLLLCVGPLNLRTLNPQSNLQTVATMSQLIRLIKENDLHEDVEFRDRTDKTNIYFKSCDIFVNFSESEGQSNVVLEAMASELPIVVQNLPGTNQMIVNNHNGFSLDADHVSEVGKVLIQLLSDETLRRTIGMHARQTIETRYDIDQIADQMIGLYQDLQHRVDPFSAKMMAASPLLKEF